MKKGIFLLLSMIAMFYACNYAGDIKDYKEDLAEGGPVNTDSSESQCFHVICR